MKRIIETKEVPSGFESLLGEEIVVWCLNYIYSGKLVGINATDILLENPSVVYETGELTAKKFKDAQPLGVNEWFIRISCIESYGKKTK